MTHKDDILAVTVRIKEHKVLFIGLEIGYQATKLQIHDLYLEKEKND